MAGKTHLDAQKQAVLVRWNETSPILTRPCQSVHTMKDARQQMEPVDR